MGRIEQDERLLLTLGPQAERFGTGLDAQLTVVAFRQVEHDRHQAGQRVDLGAERDALLGARGNAAPAALAELRQEERRRLTNGAGHNITSRAAGIGDPNPEPRRSGLVT
jgi:hypothetical protein